MFGLLSLRRLCPFHSPLPRCLLPPCGTVFACPARTSTCPSMRSSTRRLPVTFRSAALTWRLGMCPTIQSRCWTCLFQGLAMQSSPSRTPRPLASRRPTARAPRSSCVSLSPTSSARGRQTCGVRLCCLSTMPPLPLPRLFALWCRLWPACLFPSKSALRRHCCLLDFGPLEAVTSEVGLLLPSPCLPSRAAAGHSDRHGRCGSRGAARVHGRA